MKVTLKNVTKKFGSTVAVNNFSATFPDGHLICLLGPSGCGKSTVLNILCGILDVTSGQVFFDNEDVTSLSPEQRNIGMVFQNYALYPHLTVLENIAFPLEVQKVNKKIRIEKAKEIAELGVLNNEAKFSTSEIIGDSIDIAFLVLGEKMKVKTSDIKIVETIPYESENKYSAVFYKKNNETERNSLVVEAIEIIENINPNIFIFENKFIRLII